jgi:hypothetical protein
VPLPVDPSERLVSVTFLPSRLRWVRDPDSGSPLDSSFLLFSLPDARAARPRKGESVKALIALLLAGCGSEPFTSELFGAPDGGAPEIGASSEAGADGASADAACLNQYIALPGAAGSFVSFGGPDPTAPFAVEMTVRLEAAGRMGLVRAQPEPGCGWHVYVWGDRVQATVTGAFDHEVSLAIGGTGWRRIRWELGAESVLLVDGAEVGRRSAARLPNACSGFTMLGVFVVGNDNPYAWGLGDVDRLSIGASSWEFNDGLLVDNTGKFPGYTNGSARQECE